MIIIPAIDLKNGRCVRLIQGKFDQETVYSDDPVAMAAKWKEQGAELVHIVDLDGARSGTPAHFHVIEKIISDVGVSLEVGGGIRDFETIKRYLDIGVKRVVLGTSVIRDPDFVRRATGSFPDAVYAGIDARNGMVAVSGWEEETSRTAVELISNARMMGIAGVIYTDILKDGTLEGVNGKNLLDLIEQTCLPFVVSGGVSTLDDIRLITNLHERIEGVIVGKALYAGAFELKDAIEITRQN